MVPNDQNKVAWDKCPKQSVRKIPREFRGGNDLFQPKRLRKAPRKRWYLNWALEDKGLDWVRLGKQREQRLWVEGPGHSSAVCVVWLQ